MPLAWYLHDNGDVSTTTMTLDQPVLLGQQGGEGGQPHQELGVRVVYAA
jgi:hypothetical protein